MGKFSDQLGDYRLLKDLLYGVDCVDYLSVYHLRIIIEVSWVRMWLDSMKRLQ